MLIIEKKILKFVSLEMSHIDEIKLKFNTVSPFEIEKYIDRMENDYGVIEEAFEKELEAALNGQDMPPSGNMGKGTGYYFITDYGKEFLEDEKNNFYVQSIPIFISIAALVLTIVFELF